MQTGPFVNRSSWRARRGREKGKGSRASPKSLEHAYYAFAKDLQTNQRCVCYNCHYTDFVADETAYYYLVFGDFRNEEPAGFECPNCGGPMRFL